MWELKGGYLNKHGHFRDGHIFNNKNGEIYYLT